MLTRNLTRETFIWFSIQIIEFYAGLVYYTL